MKRASNMTIGERLKKARKERHMSQEELAEQIGGSRGMIANIELNRIDSPQLMIVNSICNALDINKAWLLDGVEPMEVSAAQKKKKICFYIDQLSDDETGFLCDVLKSYVEHFKK